MREALANLFKGNKLPAFVQPMNLIRNIVATIDNLRAAKPRRACGRCNQRPVPCRRCLAGDSLVIAPDNSARYAPVVALVHAIDTKQLVAIYVRFYPLFQQAYRELGYPDGYFNDRLVAVIDHLIATRTSSRRSHSCSRRFYINTLTRSSRRYRQQDRSDDSRRARQRGSVESETGARYATEWPGRSSRDSLVFVRLSAD